MCHPTDKFSKSHIQASRRAGQLFWYVPSDAYVLTRLPVASVFHPSRYHSIPTHNLENVVDVRLIICE